MVECRRWLADFIQGMDISVFKVLFSDIASNHWLPSVRVGTPDLLVSLALSGFIGHLLLFSKQGTEHKCKGM